MKLVIIFGPHAVGKMTVGQVLAKKTGLKLFHNHMTIEPVCDIFANYPAEMWRLTALFRREVFEAFVKTEEYGMIFTFMWALDDPGDTAYLDGLERLFAEHGAQVYYVELLADKEVRLERNTTENRLINKPSKRDIGSSERRFVQLEEKYRLNSQPGEIRKEHYLRLDNTQLSPEEVAGMIVEHFAL